jgi:hypothetical protein
MSPRRSASSTERSMPARSATSICCLLQRVWNGEPVQQHALDRARLQVPRLARIGEVHLPRVRRPEAELDADEHGRRDEERNQHALHRNHLQATSVAAAANAAARKNDDRNARVIVV